jgi:hypothetical protein
VTHLRDPFDCRSPLPDRQILSGWLFFAIMASWKKPDPELLPIHRPRCPRCQLRMLAVGVSTGPEGFEHRLFECPKCKHAEEKILASDPLGSGAAEWSNSDLQPLK